MALCGGEHVLQTLPTSALPCLPKDTHSSLSSHGGTGASLPPFPALSNHYFSTAQCPELSQIYSLLNCVIILLEPLPFPLLSTLSSFWPDPTPRWVRACLTRSGMGFPYFHLGHKGTQSPGVLWADIWVLLLDIVTP